MLPFSNRVIHRDLISNNDALLISILAIGLALGILFDAVVLRSESSQARKGRITWSAIALICAGAYLTERWWARGQVLRIVSTLDMTYKGKTAEHTEILPFSLFCWRCVATGDSFVAEYFLDRLLSQSGALSIRYLPRQNPSAAVEAAMQAKEIRALAEFTEEPLWRYHVAGKTTRVELVDLRSGTLERPAYRASALIASDGNVVQSSFLVDEPSWRYENGLLRRE